MIIKYNLIELIIINLLFFYITKLI